MSVLACQTSGSSSSSDDSPSPSPFPMCTSLLQELDAAIGGPVAGCSRKGRGRPPTYVWAQGAVLNAADLRLKIAIEKRRERQRRSYYRKKRANKPGTVPLSGPKSASTSASTTAKNAYSNPPATPSYMTSVPKPADQNARSIRTDSILDDFGLDYLTRFADEAKFSPLLVVGDYY